MCSQGNGSIPTRAPRRTRRTAIPRASDSISPMTPGSSAGPATLQNGVPSRRSIPESCIVQTAPEPRSMTWKGTKSASEGPG